MDIRLVSDLHLEFKKFHLEKIEGEKDMVLILAGDIFPVAYFDRIVTHPHHYGDMEFVYDFFADICERHRHVIYVFGNHEFYHGNFHQEHVNFAKHVQYQNLTVLEKSSFVLDNVAFIGSTMWTDFGKGDPIVMYNAKRGMNDYRVITQDDTYDENGLHSCPVGTLMPQTVLDFHNKARLQTFRLVRKHKKEGHKVVLVTHHAPTAMSLDKRFLTGWGSELNSCYASDMGEELVSNGVDIAVHGHTHQNHRYEVGQCVVHCNPRGYNDENPNFAYDYVIEV